MSNKQKTLQDISNYITLFMLNAIGMILELAASRVMSPYFGTSNYVWTAIIGIILLSGCIGNVLGGRISVIKQSKEILIILLLIAGGFIAYISFGADSVLSSAAHSGYSIKITSVVASIVLFLIPSAILGVATPVIMKKLLDDADDNGRESGRIHAVIAAGSLIGTFAGGFWLVPALGTKLILITLAALIVLVTIIWGIAEKIKPDVISVILLGLSFAAITIAVIMLPRNNAEKVEEISEPVSIDTEYGRIIIEDGEYNGEKVRFYKQSGAYSSATYLEESRKYEPVFSYAKVYDRMFEWNKNIKTTLMIGGAAYQYPKHFISSYQDLSMDVVEIDPVATDIAKKYFFLDDLIRDYDLENTGRLGLYTDDARLYLEGTDKKYDAILSDAFSGAMPVATLSTVEFCRLAKEHLNEDGVYMLNILGKVSSGNNVFVQSEIKTLKNVFANVWVLTVDGETGDEYANYMIVATDNDYIPENFLNYEESDNAVLLTDDYCPVDNWASTDYFD